jgi:hypothetical protein
MDHPNHVSLDPIADARAVLAGIRGTHLDQLSLIEACANDPVVFAASACWSRRVKRVIPETGETVPIEGNARIVPFIPWARQVETIESLVQAVRTGQDVAAGKSRETGLSTIAAIVLWWGWRWHGWDALLLSRVEDNVDRIGDPDTLFAKIDTVTATVPRCLLPSGCERTWLLPGGSHRKHLLLSHPDGNAITGEATTGHAGRGGRKTVAVFDEAASQAQFVAGWRSASDTVVSKWAISTHLIGSHFTGTLWPTALATGDPKPLTITYADDPDKGAYAVEKIDVDGSVTGDVGRTYVSTPWFERERSKRDLHDLRENVLCLPGTSGRSFFPPAAIALARRRVFPARRCEMDRGVLFDSPGGSWWVWREPDRSTQVVMFCDPSYGTGSANGVIAAMDADRQELLALFASPNLPPYDLSRTMVEAARGWCRGRNDPMIGWEVNGPGASMHHDLERLNYTLIYRSRQHRTTTERRTRSIGWNSTRGTKRALLGDLSRAMMDDTVSIHCEQTITEIESTVIYRDGGIGPAHLEEDVHTGAREAHGDRVIAVAGALMLCGEAAGSSPRDEPDALPDFSAAGVLGMEPGPNGGWIPV